MIEKRILIIDNGTQYINHFEALMQDYRLDIVHWREDLDRLDVYDLIVLSGTSYLPVFGAHTWYRRYLQSLHECRKPIIGICFGFHLLAKAYSKAVQLRFQPHFGHYRTTVVRPHPIFYEERSFTGRYKHAFRIRRLGNEFIELARYSNGVAAAEHRYKPIMGIQFHPEDAMDQLSTDTFFQNAVAYLLDKEARVQRDSKTA